MVGMIDDDGLGELKLRLPELLWIRLDEQARARGITVSELLAEALGRHVDRQADSLRAAGVKPPRWPASRDVHD